MLQVLLQLHSLQSLIALFPLNCMANMREKGAEMTFRVGGKLLSSTEMTQVQRMARLIPPLCNWCILLPLSLHLRSCFGQLMTYDILQSR